MRVTARGQVTIPAALRRALSLSPGDEIDFEDGGAGYATIHKREPPKSPARRQRELKQWLKRVTGIATTGMTTDEIMRLTRGE